MAAGAARGISGSARRAPTLPAPRTYQGRIGRPNPSRSVRRCSKNRRQFARAADRRAAVLRRVGEHCPGNLAGDHTIARDRAAGVRSRENASREPVDHDVQLLVVAVPGLNEGLGHAVALYGRATKVVAHPAYALRADRLEIASAYVNAANDAVVVRAHLEAAQQPTQNARRVRTVREVIT